MKKRIKIMCFVLAMIGLFTTTGCASCDRLKTDWKSEMNGGLDRVINVYTANGDLIASYEGKIDIDSDNSYIKFDINGKRYIYYNCFVETIADK